MTAARAAAAWGGELLRHIKDRENAVYEMRLPDGRRAALRLHRPGYQPAPAIRSELWWMQALARQGVAVPEPLLTRAGGLVHDLGHDRFASAIAWVEGAPLGEGGVPLAGALEDLTARFAAIGRLVAELHAATDRLELPGWFTRHRWDGEGFLGERPFWGRFWENPALSADEAALLQRARAAVAGRLEAYRAAGADFGLIHADVLRENVLIGREGPVLIDFDDCGFGFRLYDLASLASQNEDEPHYHDLMVAALTGYREIRRLDDQAAALLPMFVMLRRFASCGWVVPRVPTGDPRLRAYAARAVAAAERFLAAG